MASFWQRRAVRLTALGLALALAGLMARSCAGKRHAKESWRTVEVSRRDLTVTKAATGGVTPQNRVEIKPPIAGRIEEVLVREGEAVKQGDILAWMSSAERAALLDAARAKSAEAAQRWQTAYQPAPLIAPLDGTVIVRAVEPGQTVTTADPVVVIADRLIVQAQVDETDIGEITVGQRATITLDAYPQSLVPATVDHVAYEAETVNNVTIYQVDVLPSAVPPFMRSGMTANVTFIISDQANALVVPSEAVQQREGQAFVRLARGKRAAPVTPGASDGRWVEILSGLKEGEKILVPALKLPAADRPRSPLAPGGPGGGGRRRS
jgi:macrolide-specific efflux system membrane fusion protein